MKYKSMILISIFCILSTLKVLTCERLSMNGLILRNLLNGQTLRNFLNKNTLPILDVTKPFFDEVCDKLNEKMLSTFNGKEFPEWWWDGVKNLLEWDDSAYAHFYRKNQPIYYFAPELWELYLMQYRDDYWYITKLSLGGKWEDPTWEVCNICYNVYRYYIKDNAVEKLVSAYRVGEENLCSICCEA